MIFASTRDLTFLEGARNSGISGTASINGGGFACATCHVYVAPDWAEKLLEEFVNAWAMLEFDYEPAPVRSRPI